MKNLASRLLMVAVAILLVFGLAYAVTTGTQTTPGWPIENSSSNEVSNAASSTAATVDFTQGPNQKVTLTGACTFTFTAPTYPSKVRIKLVQDATGSRAVTWPAAVKWTGGTAPTLTSTAAHTDIVELYFDGTNYYGSTTYGSTMLDVH